MMDYTWTINGNSFVHFERPLPLAIFPDSSYDVSNGSLGDQVGKNGGLVNVALGEVVDIRITNPTMMQHPFHLHGHKFYLLGGSDTVGDSVHPVSKDSISVPPSASIRLRVLFDNPGPWLFHCHTSYHLARGMAIAFLVGKSEEQPVPPEALVHQHGSGGSSDSKSAQFPGKKNGASSLDAASSSNSSSGSSSGDGDLGFGGVFALACSLLFGCVLGMALWALILGKKKSPSLARARTRLKKKNQYERVAGSGDLDSEESGDSSGRVGVRGSRSGSSIELMSGAALEAEEDAKQDDSDSAN
jgi:uncharacterized cupredoxin-like copper-binding protein